MKHSIKSEIIENASLSEKNGVKILKLSGTHYEIGYQHGYLLSDKIKLMITQTLPAATCIVAKTLQSDYSEALDKMVRGAIKEFPSNQGKYHNLIFLNF